MTATPQSPSPGTPSVQDAVFTVNEKWQITSFNDGAVTLLGIDQKDTLGKNCKEVFSGAGRFEALCNLYGPLASGKALHNFSIVINKPGHKETTIALVTAIPIPDQNGKLTGAIIGMRDANDPTQNDSMVLDSIADGVFTVDKNFRITSFNKSAEQITGWTAKEVVGARCRDIFHSSICGDTCILAQSVKNGTPISSQSIFITNKSGHTIPINISAAPLTAPDGAVIGGVETFRDLTSVMTKDLVLESIADGVFTVDRNWRITSFNRAAEQITGWKQEDALGMSCANVFHSSICGENCAIAQSLYSGKPVPTRSIFIHDIDGQKIPISISAAPLLDHEGNVIGGVETFRDLSVVEELRKQLSKRYTFGEIISKSSAMQRIFDILPEIANSESNVLVLGESGTGKELVARAIQNSSRRSKKPFVAINCGALPENLLESELFGYKAGAFTDAKKDHPGRFAKADQGTLFLDEIGDISPALQVKLLRVLQEKVYEPLGSNEPIRADVRIIAATNRDLPTLVKNGTFREDLFYRLNIVKIMLPPLRERMEDIPILADHFAKQFSAQQGKDIVGVSDSALSILMRHDFPGNIRELQNIIEYAFILCHGGYIQPEHLPEPFAPAREDNISTSLCLNKAQPLDEIEKTAIFNALERNQWKKMTTCRELQISKDTLRRKIEKYGLKSNNEPTED